MILYDSNCTEKNSELTIKIDTGIITHLRINADHCRLYLEHTEVDEFGYQIEKTITNYTEVFLFHLYNGFISEAEGVLYLENETVSHS